MTLVNVYKDKIFQKKVAKVTKLAGDGKKYKKYLIKKKLAGNYNNTDLNKFPHSQQRNSTL